VANGGLYIQPALQRDDFDVEMCYSQDVSGGRGFTSPTELRNILAKNSTRSSAGGAAATGDGVAGGSRAYKSSTHYEIQNANFNGNTAFGSHTGSVLQGDNTLADTPRLCRKCCNQPSPKT